MNDFISKLNLEESIDKYFISKGMSVLNLEELRNEPIFNSNSYITVQCKSNSTHTYRNCISTMNKNKVDISICPHCKIQKGYEEKGIPIELLQTYANKNSLIIDNTKHFYSRWTDVITFTCAKCSNKHTIKSLAYFEKNSINKKFKCNSCIQLAKGLISKESLNVFLDNIKMKPIEKPKLLENTIFNKIATEEYLKKVNNITKWHIVEFNGSKEKSKFQCKSCGSIKKTQSQNVVNESKGCNNCFLMTQKSNVNDKIIQICKDNNIILLEQYKDVDSFIKFKCNNCGINFEKSWSKITGDRYALNCINCNKRVNKAQNTIASFVQSLIGIDPEQNNRVLIKPLELDILINNKFAIEYCGAIWHSSRFGKSSTYHQEKLDACTAKDIRLITMFDDEWKNKEDICKSRIRNLLGLTNNKIYARKCEIKKIPNEDALAFCLKNHIQGKGQTNKSYGLYYENNLVSVMTFSLPSASKAGKKKDYDWELNRFCSLLDTVVIGGANKILAAFRKDYPKDRIITFCDLRWGNGKVYENMGFKFLYRTRPNYYYIGESTNWERKHRFGFTKQKLINLFSETDITLTEKQIALKNGLFQMHDCGHLKFILE